MNITFFILGLIILIISLIIAIKSIKNLFPKEFKQYIPLSISILLFTLFIPIIINQLYIFDKGYLTIWGAESTLSFYGSFLSFLGTVILSALAVWQNKQANNISKQLMDLEKDRFRPYIKILNKDMFFVVCEQDYHGIQEIELLIDEADIFIKGHIPYKQKEYVEGEEFVYPHFFTFIFNIYNLEQTTIADIEIRHLYIIDDLIGKVVGFMYNLDRFIMQEEKKVIIQIQHQLPVKDDLTVKNSIYDAYLKKIEKTIKNIHIELGILYHDIYGREYKQDYSLSIKFSVKSLLDRAMILNADHVQIQHFTGKTPLNLP